MIDLSYLTEEEQGVIMGVLKRDAELKKAEEERVRQLQSLLLEESQRKYMTGEWFYEVKSQRHQDRIHGSEIIWASMRQKKPDFTQSMEKLRGGSGADDVMATPKPPSQQPMEAQEQMDRRSESLTSEARRDSLRMTMRSPKLRHNPFNTVQVEIDTERPCPQLPNGTQGPSSTHTLEISSPTEQLSEARAEEPVVPAKRPAPVPRKRTKLPRSQSSRTDSSGSGITTPSASTTSTTRGILKQASSCSSIDSHQRSEVSGVDTAQEMEPMGEKFAVGRREEVQEEKEAVHVERGDGERSYFVPVTAGESLEEREKSEEMTQQHAATSRSCEGQQRETTSKSHDGQQRETTSKSHDGQQRETNLRSPEGQQKEFNVNQQRETTSRSDEGREKEITSKLDGRHLRVTPLQTSRPKHDAGRSLGLSVFTRQEERKPSGGKEQQLFSPPSSRSTRLAWPPAPDQSPQEKISCHTTDQRWRDSSPEKYDPDIRAKDTNTDSLKAAEDTLHEPKRSVLPSALDAVEKPSEAESSKSPVATASQTSKLTEEEGASIAKVLEWFNRSTDSSNRQDTDSMQDLEEAKDDITDSDEEAKATVSKLSENVYTIIPRQEKPKEKKKLFPDDICWGEEQSVDLSDEAPEQSDPQIEGPTITIRPFQPGIGRDSTCQLSSPSQTMTKLVTSYQPQRSSQSPLQTETSYQSHRSSQSPLQIETSYQLQHSSQSPHQTETTFQSQRSSQLPLQTETSYQSKRSIQSPLQTGTTTETNNTTYQSKRPVHSAVKTETTYQPQRPVNTTPNRDMTVQTHPPVHSVLKPDTAFKAQSHRSDAHKQSSVRVEDVHALRSSGAGAGGNVRQDTRVSQQQDSQTVGQDEKPKIANLKSFWERGNSGPKILISRTNLNTEKKAKPERQMDFGPTVREQVEEPQTSVQNLNNEMKTKPDQQIGIGQAVRERVEEPQESVQNFEIRSMSTSLRPQNEEKTQRKQNKEIRTHKEIGADDTLITQKYINVDVGHENVPENTSSTERNDAFKVSSRSEKERLSSEVKSPPLSLGTSRFARKVSEEALKYSCTASKPSAPSARSESTLKAEDREEETPFESRSLSRTSTPVLPSSPVLPAKQNTQHLEKRKERLKQLKSFWESEGGSRLYNSKLNLSSGSTSSNLNKRFSKSAFDLRSAGLSCDDDADDASEEHSFPVFIMKDKTEKISLGDTHFKSLRDFWAGSPSVQNRPKSPTFEDRFPTSKSPPVKPQDMTGASQSSAQQWNSQPNSTSCSRGTDDASEKSYGRSREGGWPNKASSTNREKEHPSSPSLKTKHRIRDEAGSGTNSRRASVDSRSGKSSHRSTSVEPAQRKATHHQSRRNSEQVSLSSALALKNRSGQQRRTSTGNLNERAGNLRKATSMYSLAFCEDQEQTSPKPAKKSQESSYATKSKKTQEFGLSFTKKAPEGAGKSKERVSERRPSRTSEDPEWQQPLARSFIPQNYQHYLGIPERTGTCPAAPAVTVAPETREEVCTSFSDQPDCEWSRGSDGPVVRSSTPVGPEEAGGRRGSLGPRPSYTVWANEDLSQESPRNSTSESCASSHKNSKCDEEDDNPVQRALRRAAARPAFTKSLEDITAVTGPERESERANVFMHCSGDVTPTAGSLALSFSNPEHMRKMSRSVPSFLQQDAEDDSDSLSVGSSQSGVADRRGVARGRGVAGRRGVSLTNSVSSGMASLSSVSGSVMSVCSGDFGGVEVQGSIQFALNYVQKLKEFHIFVVQCKNLAVVDFKRNRSDSYVKSYLIPDKAGLGKRKTSVKKKTVNPLFNEILRYRVRMDYLKSQVLNLSVWHHDTFGKNSFLGEVEMDLSVWDFNNTQMNYMALKARTTSSTQPTEYRGEMRLAIRYLPQMSYSKTPSNSGEVHIWVKECKNLPHVRGATVDPYVKCFVLPDTSRKSRQKTRVLKRTDCPVFNHTMVYDGFQPEDLREACVELTVWDRDRLANHLLGGLRLGLGTGKSYGALVDWMDSTGQEVALWERMIDSPTEWVEDVLPLRVLMTHSNK